MRHARRGAVNREPTSGHVSDEPHVHQMYSTSRVHPVHHLDRRAIQKLYLVRENGAFG